MIYKKQVDNHLRNCFSFQTSSASQAGLSCQQKPKLFNMQSWVFLRYGTLLLLLLRPALLLRRLDGAASPFMAGISIFLHFKQLKVAFELLAQQSAHSVCTQRSHSSHIIHYFPSSVKSKYICLQQKQYDYFSYCFIQSGHKFSALFSCVRLYFEGLQDWQILLLQRLILIFVFFNYLLGDFTSLDYD